VDNLSTGRLENLANVYDKIEFYQGDVTNALLLLDLVRETDFVFHLAALASVPRSVDSPLETHAACATGTVTVLDAARRAAVKRVVYASSSAVYGDQPVSAKRETDLPSPISPYGAAKLTGEIYCQAFQATYGLETVCVRYFNVYGPRQDPESPYSAVIPRFITALLRCQAPVIYGDGKQSRDFTYVSNVVEATLLAAWTDGAAGRVFNAAMGRCISLLELLEALQQILGTRIEPQFDPPRPGDIRESMADITLARRLLGYEPKVSFYEGLERSIAYYRSICSKLA